MASFSKVLTVTAATYSPLASPSVVIDSIIQPKRLVVQNVDAADRVYVSLDGVNDHGMLLDNVLSPMCQMEWIWQLAQKVWLRTATGTATEVQVISEG
jgi:hypothetical protein